MTSFETVYALYHDKVLRYLVSMIGSDYAEDVTQETFLKVHRNMSRLRDESKVSSWIYRIALNTARDRMRKESKLEKTMPGCRGPAPAMEEIHDTRAGSHVEGLLKKEMVECFVDFVKKLPRNYFTVYVSSEFDGLSISEIADKLALAPDTVKVRLHRARKKLYEELRAHCRYYYSESGTILGELKR